MSTLSAFVSGRLGRRGYVDTIANRSQFQLPTGVCLDPSDSATVICCDRGLIRRIKNCCTVLARLLLITRALRLLTSLLLRDCVVCSRLVSTIAGDAKTRSSNESFRQPHAILGTRDGVRILVADTLCSRIQMIDVVTRSVTTVFDGRSLPFVFKASLTTI